MRGWLHGSYCWSHYFEYEQEVLVTFKQLWTSLILYMMLSEIWLFHSSQVWCLSYVIVSEIAQTRYHWKACLVKYNIKNKSFSKEHTAPLRISDIRLDVDIQCHRIKTWMIKASNAQDAPTLFHCKQRHCKRLRKKKTTQKHGHLTLMLLKSARYQPESGLTSNESWLLAQQPLEQQMICTLLVAHFLSPSQTICKYAKREFVATMCAWVRPKHDEGRDKYVQLHWHVRKGN